MKKMYTTLRGVVTSFRPYRELSQIDREKVLRDYLDVGSKEVQKKWNISDQTLGHVIYHNKAILRKIEDEHFEREGL